MRFVGVEPAGHGVDSGEHGASISAGTDGVLHGARTRILQEPDGLITPAHSISAGLDYPGSGPEHAYLAAEGLATYESATDDEALAGFHAFSELEGIVPALEAAHVDRVAHARGRCGPARLQARSAYALWPRGQGRRDGEEDDALMKIFRFDKDSGKVLDRYGSSDVTIVPIAKGHQMYRITTAHFDPGGTIGQHLTGMPQVFMVLAGRGWVSGKSGGRVPISAGQAVMWESEEPHESGTEDGMTVVMLQAIDPQVQMSEPPG